MANSNNIGGTNPLASLAVQQQDRTPSNTLGSEDFLKLMVEQLRNQSPTNPADSADFLGQLAQFSTVSGIQDLQKSLTSIASGLQSAQALQASTMVGRSVVIAANQFGYAGADGMSGVIPIDSATPEVKVGIFNSAGTLVKEMTLGAADAGDLAFKWDGLDSAGAAAPPGRYQIRATALTENGTVALDTLLHARVESVTLQPNGGGAELNLAGFGSIDMAAVRTVI
jgi:flagellar basal-body rod modification protein FlgD